MPVATLQDYQVNDLVVSTKKQFKGIGCVVKVLKCKVLVTFGHDGLCKCKPEDLDKVDTSECKRVSFADYQGRVLKSTGIGRIIVGSHLEEFVGVRWIAIRPITEEDLKIYPRVV